MSDQEDAGETWVCPVPQAHDRFEEAHYFLHRMETAYHKPQIFRFHLNAYIAAARAVHEMLRIELERVGQVAWWKERRREFAEDDVLARFAIGRNIVLHQRSLLNGSRVSTGLFRGARLKFAYEVNLETDEPSDELLKRMAPKLTDLLVDPDHTAVGEELGVKRLYFVRELSDSEDVLSAARRALARTSRALAEAHNRLGGEHVPIEDADVIDEAYLDQVSVLLESDIDPTLHYKWGWIDEPSVE